MFSSSIFTGAVALLAGSAAASFNMPRQFSNTTTSSAAAASTGAAAPAVGATLIVGSNTWKYDGCAVSSSNYQGFTISSQSTTNSWQTCLASCSGSRYAGLYQSSCYCANILDAATTLSQTATCSLPCPGNSAQSCGGGSSKRQLVPNSVVLSLFEQVANVAIVPAPVATAAPTVGQITYITYINNYFDVCGCASGLSMFQATQTLTYAACGCATSAAPVVPMTTTTKVCANCGPNGSPATVTVTVPCTATATGSAIYYNGTCVGAGCPVVPSNNNLVVPVCVGAGCPTTSTVAICLSGQCSPAVTTVTVPAVPVVTSTVTVNGGCPAVATVPVVPAVPVSTLTVCVGAGCPAVTTVTKPATTGSTVVVCNGVNCPATTTKPSVYTGAASAAKAGGLVMAAGLAAALL